MTFPVSTALRTVRRLQRSAAALGAGAAVLALAAVAVAGQQAG